jgi:preprotein translocase subunit SecG
MALLLGFLTFILVMNCLFLMLLILIQLPKKEAGAGIAFGGGATDALFGAGSGNALTKLTKYSASIFVGLAVLLSVLNMHEKNQGSRQLEQELQRQVGTASKVLVPPVTAKSQTPVTPSNTNLLAPAATNLLKAPITLESTNTAAPGPAPSAGPPAGSTAVPIAPVNSPSGPAAPTK